MPELPEAERERQRAQDHLAGRRIARVRTAPDSIVYDGVAPRRFASTLTGRTVVAVRRRGKHLWMELDRRPWPTFHFGMGGRFHVYERASELPPYWKVEIRTDEGTHLAMTNPRRLGRIRLRENPPAEPPISRLGLDPYLDSPSTRTLFEILSRRQGTIKSVLLDQSFLAGVGNWIADEVLYQARIDPRRPGKSLSKREVTRLRVCLRRIVAKAVAVGADSDRFPRSWLFHVRWGKNPEARTRQGEKIAHTTLGGRTTAWVPRVQK